MTKKRILSLCLTVVLVLSMMVFAGCGSKEEKAKEDPKPTNTQELLDANKKANEDVESYSLAGKGTAEIKAASQGIEMTVPIEFDATADVSDDVIHGKGTASMTMQGETQKVEPEIYVDLENKKTYSKTSEDEDWSSSDLSIDTEDVKIDMPDVIKDALEFSEEDDAYVLTCDLTTIDIKELIKSIADEQEDVEGLDEALNAIDEANLSVDSGTLTLKYDKDTCLLTSMTVKEFAGSGSTEITEGQNMDITASADMEFTFSDYNKVSEDAFELPDAA